ncbi:MAG: AzlD domain-containing protein [Clostridia bacterium]|nr:AzlD domain-containing protein [Clostridia bacterium]
MPEALKFALYLLIMAGVTYLVRMLPLVLVKRKIENRFIKSFLYYVPYSVLSVMTVPAIFAATPSLISAVIGFAVALVLAYFERGLMTVALSGCGAVLATELILLLIK